MYITHRLMQGYLVYGPYKLSKTKQSGITRNFDNEVKHKLVLNAETDEEHTKEDSRLFETDHLLWDK